MDNFDKNSATVGSAIASFYEATLKDTEKIINETYFWHRLNNLERIVIYGHSLGSVDIPYFKKYSQVYQLEQIGMYTILICQRKA